MIALLMAYAVVVGASLAAAGVLLERIAAARGRPRRWIWPAMLALSLAIGLGMPWWNASRSTGASPSTSGWVVRTIAAGADRARFPRTNDVLNAFRIPAVRPAALARLDRVARTVWMVGSTAVALVYLTASAMLVRRRRQWQEIEIRDCHVLLAPDVGPAVVGAWNTEIVLPAWALGLDSRAVDLVLTHEREHLRARDPLLIHLAAVAVLVVPWNPAAWWMLSRLKVALELDCDARVLGRMDARPDTAAPEAALCMYAELLVRIASQPSRHPLIAPAMLERSSALSRRISAMCPRQSRFRAVRITAASCSALVLLFVALLLPAPPLRAQETGQGRTSQPEPTSLPAEGVTWPTPIKQVDPAYTEAAKNAKVEGVVRIKAVVETDGTVGRIRVVKSLDTEYGLDRSAIEAASKWLFKPATKNGKPVPVSVEIEMAFRLH